MSTVDPSVIVALVELARQVRSCTLDLLRVPDPAWLTWSPSGTSNHILWHAGHTVWLQDALSIQPLTGRGELPAGWAEMFGQHCRPPVSTIDWPNVRDIRRQLESQLERILTLIDKHADAIAAGAGQQPPGGGWPLLPGMLHGWHDEARHQGEMYLLHKLASAKWRRA